MSMILPLLLRRLLAIVLEARPPQQKIEELTKLQDDVEMYARVYKLSPVDYRVTKIAVGIRIGLADNRARLGNATEEDLQVLRDWGRKIPGVYDPVDHHQV